MRTHRLCLIALALATGCGGEDEHLVDAAGTLDGPPGDAALDGAIDASVDAGGTVCGGILGVPCAADEYCDFPLDSCGFTDEQGTCKPRPEACPDGIVAEPRCACDNMVYGNECDAYAAGFDLNAAGGCAVPDGWFACGYTQCNLFTDYCQHDVSDIGGEPDTFTCKPLPGCPSQFPTCGCLADEPCGSFCTGDGPTGLTLTCPGG
ncbi:MAG TPA: hypothetical protein VHE35_25665 [Kofleriaceae bacterium]|nr:hypothetical protein [Kofleriaceae bacterium]